MPVKPTLNLKICDSDSVGRGLAKSTHGHCWQLLTVSLKKTKQHTIKLQIKRKTMMRAGRVARESGIPVEPEGCHQWVHLTDNFKLSDQCIRVKRYSSLRRA